jgi:hypothetical protein
VTRRLTPAELIERDNAPYKPYLEAVLRYASLDLPVFLVNGIRRDPKTGVVICLCGRPQCDVPGKHPAMKDWYNNATTDPEKLKFWFSFNYTGSEDPPNIGMVCGQRSGIFVLDVDQKHGGLESFAELEKELGPIPPTPRQRTGSGGLHILVRYPGQITKNKIGKLAPGIDFRTDGGQIVVAPSRNANGSYSWEVPLSVPFADLPQKWIEKIRSLEEGPDRPGVRQEIDYSNRTPAEPGTFQFAVDKYNEDHRSDSEQWPVAGGTCPICEHHGCFGRLKDSPTHWYCFSQNHLEGGRPAPSGGYYGDQLDIDAHELGLTRTQLLRKRGYLGNEVARATAEVKVAEAQVALARAKVEALKAETGEHVETSQSSTTTSESAKPPDNVSTTPETNDPEDGDSGPTGLPPQEQFVYDVMESKWYRHFPKLGWVGPFTTEALNEILVALGVPEKALRGYRAGIRQFYRRKMVFNTDETLIEVDGMLVFNVYKHTTFKPFAGPWHDYEALIMNLVGADHGAYEYVLDWLAAPIQTIYHRINSMKMLTALVFHGDQGGGKGLLERAMRIIYGDSNVARIGQQSLDGKFNGELANVLFVVANEVMSSTNRSAETANKIKPWVTESTIEIEQKYRQMETVENHFNIIFTSNDERPVLIEKSDRRFSVFKSNALDKTLGERIHNDMVGSRAQLAGFYAHLLQRQVKVRPGQLYDSEAKVQMVRESSHSEERFVYQLQQEGWLTISQPWADAAPPNQPRMVVEEDQTTVLSSTLTEVYKHWCNAMGYRHRGGNRLGHAVKAAFPNARTFVKKRGGMPTRVWDGIPMEPPNGELIELQPQKKDQKLVAATDPGDHFEG